MQNYSDKVSKLVRLETVTKPVAVNAETVRKINSIADMLSANADAMRRQGFVSYVNVYMAMHAQCVRAIEMKCGNRFALILAWHAACIAATRAREAKPDMPFHALNRCA